MRHLGNLSGQKLAEESVRDKSNRSAQAPRQTESNRWLDFMTTDQHHLMPIHSLWIRGLMMLLITMFALGVAAIPAIATENTGKQLFQNHCSGCHVNGGNVIRRGRTLKLAALQRNGVDDPDAIAAIAREGIGQMSGYADVLGQEGDRLVAEWIWEQAQNAWIQG